MTKVLRAVEDSLASLTLAVMVFLTLSEMITRAFSQSGIPGATPIVQHLTLWVSFLGSAVAAREGRLLSFATRDLLSDSKAGIVANVFASAVAAGVAALLCWAGIDLVMIESDAGTHVTFWLPVWVTQLVLPVSFGLIAIRLAWRAAGGWRGRAIAFLGLVAGLVLAQFPELVEFRPSWPSVLIILVATLSGGPIFAALGGLAALLFMHDGTPAAAVLVETYRLSVSPSLPAIPLFTLVGILLAQGHASQRLLRVFRAVFGWFPGGTALVCVLLCAFFSIPTGGSGVTILALGGLLLPALLKDGYRERFSVGLLTGSGSLGLLFPPALPLILFGIVAGVAIEDLFVGGLLPGVLMVILVGVWGVREGIRSRITRTRFERGEALAAMWAAKWELLLPVVALISIFGGFATLVEAASVTVIYTIITQSFVLRDLSLRRDLPSVFHQTVILVGGVLLILCVAVGFSSWVVDAEIPARTLFWVQEHIHSPLVFLLTLNAFLLLVGCVMDIFSATVVVVPLILPLALAFGIDPVHLGIIFVANLELGYLTPPVGLNLFFASYRFEKPLLSVYRSALPMLLILALGVLGITYLPWLSTGLVNLIGRH